VNAAASDGARAALTRIDRAERALFLALLATGVIEGVLLALLLWRMDFHDRTHVVIFLAAMLTYCTLSMGLVALGAYVNGTFARLVSAMESMRDELTGR
jgi:hypothetical protein